jgi:menaquinone-dependent protoporphyrinogen oxidase
MILVAYASKHGATEGIAHHIARSLNDAGKEAVARSVSDVDDLGAQEAAVIGSAVYAGSWRKEAVEFVDAHADELARLPVWLFSSGPLGEQVADEEEQPKQLGEMRARISPREHRMFFGALDAGRLSFGERMIVKAVKAPQGDFRNWDEIAGWARSSPGCSRAAERARGDRISRLDAPACSSGAGVGLHARAPAAAQLSGTIVLGRRPAPDRSSGPRSASFAESPGGQGSIVPFASPVARAHCA